MTQFSKDFGIAFASPDRDMGDGEWAYDSRKKKWTVDLEATPEHLKLFTLSGGTKWVIDTATEDYREEIIFQIEHKMPFPPRFVCFFYIVDAASGFSELIGNFTSDRAPMLYNSIFIGEEGLFAGVDDTHFFIKHFAETFGFGSGNHTFGGSDYRFRVRYELLNQEAFYLGNKGY